MLGHLTKPMESNLRRSCRSDKHSKVGRDWYHLGGTKGIASPDVANELASLLNDPNTGSPANVEASNLYKDNRKEYTKRVRETVEKSWDD